MTDAEKRARFERALHAGGNGYSVEDVVRMVRDNRAQYWSHGDGTVITKIHKTVHYWLVTGVLEDCLPLDDEISEWARGEGCTLATAAGRKGWLRTRLPSGWHLQPYAFIKDLSDGVQ